jgi:hypothetical protein
MQAPLFVLSDDFGLDDNVEVDARRRHRRAGVRQAFKLPGASTIELQASRSLTPACWLSRSMCRRSGAAPAAPLVAAEIQHVADGGSMIFDSACAGPLASSRRRCVVSGTASYCCSAAPWWTGGRLVGQGPL